MAAAWVIEAVDVLEQAIVRHWFKSNGERRLHLPTRFPRPAPDQLGLDGLEECLDGGVVIAIALAAHRYLEAVFAQDLLGVVGAVLAAAVAVEDAAARRGSQGDGHLQRPDRQVALHAVADGPADDAPRRAAPRMQVQDHSQIQPNRRENSPPDCFLVRLIPLGSRCN